MTQDQIIEMARQAELCWSDGRPMIAVDRLEAFAKMVAETAIARDRADFDIDELCARQNKIGYKQGYRAGQTDEREVCAKICIERGLSYKNGAREYFCADAIRARGNP